MTFILTSHLAIFGLYSFLSKEDAGHVRIHENVYGNWKKIGKISPIFWKEYCFLLNLIKQSSDNL